MNKDRVQIADCTTLEALPLPECLALRDDRTIVIAGHRITLFTFLDAINDLKRRQLPVTATQLESVFPTVDRSRLEKILEFVGLHSAVVQQYFDRQLNEAEEIRKQFTSVGPEIEMLRQRQRDALR